MNRERYRRLGASIAGACAVLLIQAGMSRGGDSEAELRGLIEQQRQQIEELTRRVDALTKNHNVQPASAQDASLPDPAVKKIVEDYLKANPGAGMPPSVETGYKYGNGFYIRSTPDPKYVKWEDGGKIPFELRFRGRVQLDGYFYKGTSHFNHFTNSSVAIPPGDFNQLEVKRLRLIWEGTAFDPHLRYRFELDGNTRGLGGFQNNKVVQTAGAFDPNGSLVSPVGGGVSTDHAVRLFAGWVAYDFHGIFGGKCEPECPDGPPAYKPTFTIIGGKMKPAIAMEEWIAGSGNEQFVEFSMADWFFDADDDNLLMAAGVQIKALEDRLFLSALVTNGNESQFPNTQMDDYPGLNIGWWYDFGGTWNSEKNKWDLYGDCFSDIDESENPVVRLGGGFNFVPLDRRSAFGDLEQSRVFVVPGGFGGTRLINVLNGDGGGIGGPAGAHAVDEFDSYTYDLFLAGKYRGFSLSNEWWFRNLDSFQAGPAGNNNIIYTVGAANALFPRRALFDYGTQLQGGYFIVPKRVELVARWSRVSGKSGNITGNGNFAVVAVPGVVGPVRVYNGAFRNFSDADEIAFGLNYFFKRHLLKWQTDFGWYRGGNPAGGGTSPAGFIPGLDGWLLRTQLQLAF